MTQDHEWVDENGHDWQLDGTDECAKCGLTPDAHPYRFCELCLQLAAEHARLRARLHERHSNPVSPLRQKYDEALERELSQHELPAYDGS